MAQLMIRYLSTTGVPTVRSTASRDYGLDWQAERDGHVADSDDIYWYVEATVITHSSASASRHTHNVKSASAWQAVST